MEENHTFNQNRDESKESEKEPNTYSGDALNKDNEIEYENFQSEESIKSEEFIETTDEPTPEMDDSTIVHQSDLNHDEANFRNGRKKQRRPSKNFLKGLVSNISVAVITSLLTAFLVVHFQTPVASDANGNKSVEANSQIESSNVSRIPSSFVGTDAKTIADIAEELAPAIVGVVNLKEIKGFNFQNQNVESGSGSGVIFKKDGNTAYIITNNHVIEGANKVEVSLYNGERAEAEVVGADALTDLAVLKIDGQLVDKVATFGDSSVMRPGDEVVVIGNPLGLEFSRTVTQGIISATERNIAVSTSAGDWELSVIQTDAAINPGNSGGALINARGEVIGINSLKISREGVKGLGFAIPSNDVVPIVEELIEHGGVKRAYLGIQMYNVRDLASFYRQSLFGSLEKGVIIAGIEAGSPADLAGLQVNDVIVGINGEEISHANEIKQYLYRNVKPGESIEIEFYRDGQKQTVNVVTSGN